MFLQGPHGPFFWRLGAMLRAAGAEVWRVGFNAGDRAFWFGAPGFLPYRGRPEDWPAALAEIIDAKGVTDIVLYGDARPVHAAAVLEARRRGITLHAFEEGYLRPYWITYERGGTNGHSRLMDLGVAAMREALAQSDMDVPEPPARWGELRQHVFWAALYHWFVLFRNGAFANFRSHRDLPVAREAWIYTRRLLALPLVALDRAVATRRVRLGGFPYHLVLLQLEHDSSFRAHGPFERQEEFLRVVLDGFARGAPRHHHLVFKAHPLENGRSPLRRLIRRMAQERGVAGRVHYVAGGKLARLLDHARSAVTVNSTAAQQVLWRGIPLKVFGRAVYGKPEFASSLPLDRFFAEAPRPDGRAYRDYRRFLLETSQIPGGFYSAPGRRALLRQVVDMMLSDVDPYDALRLGRAAPRETLRLVR
nr:capsular biosynthesis protein [Rubellimicrobium sp. CFH 75288]